MEKTAMAMLFVVRISNPFRADQPLLHALLSSMESLLRYRTQIRTALAERGRFGAIGATAIIGIARPLLYRRFSFPQPIWLVSAISIFRVARFRTWACR